MIYSALSIVAPNGTKILEGIKQIEVRSWTPQELPLKNLVIVENKNFLNDGLQEEQGIAIAIVDIESIHEWKQDEIKIACASYWEDGYFAWVITNVRPFPVPMSVIAIKKIYTLDFKDHDVCFDE